MGLKVTAAEAARLVDRHERIVREHLQRPEGDRGRLPADKVGNAWRIDTDDLERVPGWKVNQARLAELQERDEHTVERLAAKVARLESEISDLRSRIRVLERRQGSAEASPATGVGGTDAGESTLSRARAGSLAGWSASDVSDYGEPSDFDYSALQRQPAQYEDWRAPLSSLPMLTPTREGLPPGSVRLRKFAEVHDVSIGTLNSQAQGHKVEVTAIETGARDERKERWLTPAQQGAVIAFWRRIGTKHKPCPDCPHDAAL